LLKNAKIFAKKFTKKIPKKLLKKLLKNLLKKMLENLLNFFRLKTGHFFLENFCTLHYFSGVLSILPLQIELASGSLFYNFSIFFRKNIFFIFFDNWIGCWNIHVEQMYFLKPKRNLSLIFLYLYRISAYTSESEVLTARQYVFGQKAKLRLILTLLIVFLRNI